MKLTHFHSVGKQLVYAGDPQPHRIRPEHLFLSIWISQVCSHAIKRALIQTWTLGRVKDDNSPVHFLGDNQLFTPSYERKCCYARIIQSCLYSQNLFKIKMVHNGATFNRNSLFCQKKLN